MSTKDVTYPLMRHEIMVGRAKLVLSKLIDAHTETKLLLDDLVTPSVAPQAPQPPSGVGISKTIAVFIGAAILSVSAGAGYSHRGTEMATKTVAKNKHDAAGFLVAAREAQIRKEWEKAADLYHKAYDCGSGPECSLGRMAECQMYDGKFDAATTTLNQLIDVTHGESATAFYLRGLIAFQAKDYETARSQFTMAEMQGDRRAVLMLKRIP